MALARSALRYDVTVVGAGPAGAASALALRRRGLSVALLERAPCGDALPCVANEADETDETNEASPRRRRVWSPGEGLSAAGQAALGELGLWDAFKRQGHRPSYLTQSAWGSDELRNRHAITHTLGADYHLDRARFDDWLRTQATGAGAELFDETRVTSAAWLETGHFVLSCHRAKQGAPLGSPGEALEFESAQLIDATGRSAWLLRRFGGVRRTEGDLVCVGRDYDHALFEPSILVETAPNGWWYSAPLTARRALALYFTAAAAAKGALSEQGFRDTLAQAARSAARFAGAKPAGSLQVYPAAPVRSTWPSQLPLLAVGDAAAAFDPISGSGLCFAFRSALEAAMVLDEARAGNAELYAGFQQGVGNVFEDHLRRRRELYAHEQRWPQSPFWARQHAAH